MPTHSTVYILQPCLWDFHCSSFKDMGLQIPLISTGSLPTRKLGTSHYSLLFQALGSECQDFCLSGLKEVWTQHLLTFMESLLSLWMKSCDGETIKIDMALLAVISHMVLYLPFLIAFHTPPAGLKISAKHWTMSGQISFRPDM